MNPVVCISCIFTIGKDIISLDSSFRADIKYAVLIILKNIVTHYVDTKTLRVNPVAVISPTMVSYNINFRAYIAHVDAIVVACISRVVVVAFIPADNDIADTFFKVDSVPCVEITGITSNCAP